jgi:hypothetical protein
VNSDILEKLDRVVVTKMDNVAKTIPFIAKSVLTTAKDRAPGNMTELSSLYHSNVQTQVIIIKNNDLSRSKKKILKLVCEKINPFLRHL